MKIMRVSATHARNNFFELLNIVAAGGEVTINKDGREAVVMTSKKKGTDIVGLTRALEKCQKYFKNWSLSDSPLRKPGAAAFLGRWDKKK